MPPFAFGANAFFTIGGVNGSSGQLSVFHYYAGEILGGGIPSGGGGSFGRGVQYLGKSVPGFTGREHGGRNAMLDNMAARQAMQNKFRRERIQKIKENGKLYIQGYSTTQGMLNVQWYLWSPDWSLIDFENLKEVRDLTKAYILRNLGMLRAIISPNAEGKIDFSLYNTRADTLEERVYKRWNTTTENLKYAIARGGL
jgi:hypothetical protein